MCKEASKQILDRIILPRPPRFEIPGSAPAGKDMWGPINHFFIHKHRHATSTEILKMSLWKWYMFHSAVCYEFKCFLRVFMRVFFLFDLGVIRGGGGVGVVLCLDIRVVHFTWIKCFKSKQNSLIIKDEVKYNKFKCPKSRQHFDFDFKKLFQYLLTKVSCRFKLKACALNLWVMMIYDHIFQ